MSGEGVTQPLASVVVPVYNAERWLPETLTDLLGQTLRDVEFIFVDDGSTDGSVALLESAAARDCRIRVLHQDRKFAGCARNLGMDAARGKWFIALDADDRFEPTLLEEAVRRGEETDAQVVLFDADYLVMPEEKCIPLSALARALKLPSIPFRPSEETFEAFRVMATWNKLYRMEYLRQNRFRYQETFECNDIRFVFLSIAAASRITALPRRLLHYRIGLDENVQSKKEEHPFDVVEAYASLQQELGRIGLWERFRKVYITRAAISLAGSRIADFRSAKTARVWFDRVQSSDLAKLGLTDLSVEDFIGPGADNLRIWLQSFGSLSFDEWIWNLLFRFRQSGERNRWLLAETKGKLAKTKGKLAETKALLAETKGKLAETKRKLVETKAKLAKATIAKETQLRSFSCRLGFALTWPLRAIIALFMRS